MLFRGCLGLEKTTRFNKGCDACLKINKREGGKSVSGKERFMKHTPSLLRFWKAV